MEKEELDIYNQNCLVEINKSQKDEQKDSKVSANSLPSIDYIYKNKGKEGELRAFNNNGKGECYLFTKGEWTKMGDVIGGEDDGRGGDSALYGNDSYNSKKNTLSVGGPKIYEGDKHFPAGEYDYIFDVDIAGDYKKLPFNFDGNKLVAAEKFCRRENIHLGNKEDIIKFLKQNASTKPKYDKDNKNKDKFSNHFAESKLDKIKLIILIIFI